MIHSVEASKVFTKEWLESKILEAKTAEEKGSYMGTQATIKLKEGAKELLTDSKPIVQSPKLVEFMKYHLEKMIRPGKIEQVVEVTGNSCPAFLVKKPGKKDYDDPESWRLVVNFKIVSIPCIAYGSL